MSKRNKKNQTDQNNESKASTINRNRSEASTINRNNSNYVSESYLQCCSSKSSNVAGMNNGDEPSSYDHVMPFYKQNLIAPLWAQDVRVGEYEVVNSTSKKSPSISHGNDRDYVERENFTSFLRSDNSFLCPWSWNGAIGKTHKSMHFEPGSFFEYQWDVRRRPRGT